VLTADFLIPAIVEALVLPLGEQRELRRRLLSHLRNREILLVLDNMEHLQAGIPLLAEMLHHAPRLTLLVTSRERLKLDNEWVFDLQGLPVAEDPAVADAVELFLYHTRRVQSGFAVNHAEEAQIARICQLVGGLPLAIELAAAWTRLLSYGEIARQVKSNLRFLAAEGRAGEERHASLQAVFDQSWWLLSPAEQEALAALSIFRGGFDSEATAVVAGATLPMLAALLDKSLLRRCSNGRLFLHVLVRQYAGEKLAETGKLSTVRQRHLAYFVALTESAETQLNGSDAETRQPVLEANHNNLRVALDWAMENSNHEQVAQLTYALNCCWRQDDDMNQGIAQDGPLRGDMEEASAALANSTSFWQSRDGTGSRPG
jgi:predicted ATPase